MKLKRRTQLRPKAQRDSLLLIVKAVNELRQRGADMDKRNKHRIIVNRPALLGWALERDPEKLVLDQMVWGEQLWFSSG